MNLASVALLLAVSLNPGSAKAAVYGDDLAKCLVESTTEENRIQLAQWIFTVISAHPSAASLANVSDTERTEVARKAGAVFEKLLTQSCSEQTRKAVKYEGTEAVGKGFELLGKIAMTTLLEHPTVAAESTGLLKYVDEAKLRTALGSSGNPD